jgi:hypothetical protein
VTFGVPRVQALFVLPGLGHGQYGLHEIERLACSLEPGRTDERRASTEVREKGLLVQIDCLEARSGRSGQSFASPFEETTHADVRSCALPGREEIAVPRVESVREQKAVVPRLDAVQPGTQERRNPSILSEGNGRRGAKDGARRMAQPAAVVRVQSRTAR